MKVSFFFFGMWNPSPPSVSAMASTFCVLAPSYDLSLSIGVLVVARAITCNLGFAIVLLLIKIGLSNIIGVDESIVDTCRIEETSKGLGMPTKYILVTKYYDIRKLKYYSSTFKVVLILEVTSNIPPK